MMMVISARDAAVLVFVLATAGPSCGPGVDGSEEEGDALPEACNGVDDDRNGVIDDGDPAADPSFADTDGDGWSLCTGDCDDADGTVHPGSPEWCDGLDTDCDGLPPDDENDADGDGSRLCDGDCDDADPDFHPFAEEQCDGLDNDCDGEVEGENDADGDGDLACADCDDSDPDLRAAEVPYNLIDDDCDAWRDEGVCQAPATKRLALADGPHGWVGLGAVYIDAGEGVGDLYLGTSTGLLVERGWSPSNPTGAALDGFVVLPGFEDGPDPISTVEERYAALLPWLWGVIELEPPGLRAAILSVGGLWPIRRTGATDVVVAFDGCGAGGPVLVSLTTELRSTGAIAEGEAVVPLGRAIVSPVDSAAVRVFVATDTQRMVASLACAGGVASVAGVQTLPSAPQAMDPPYVPLVFDAEVECDTDGDGIRDVVILEGFSLEGSQPVGLSVHRGIPDGGYDAGRRWWTRDFAVSASMTLEVGQIACIEGDWGDRVPEGTGDLVVVSGGRWAITVWVSLAGEPVVVGDNQFTLPPPFEFMPYGTWDPDPGAPTCSGIGDNEYLCSPGDIDGDGWDELVMADGSEQLFLIDGRHLATEEGGYAASQVANWRYQPEAPLYARLSTPCRRGPPGSSRPGRLLVVRTDSVTGERDLTVLQ